MVTQKVGRVGRSLLLLIQFGVTLVDRTDLHAVHSLILREALAVHGANGLALGFVLHDDELHRHAVRARRRLHGQRHALTNEFIRNRLVKIEALTHGAGSG